MAKNWTAAEAAKVIIEGKDIDAIADIAHRFPVISVMLAKCNNAAIDVMAAVPEFITIRKMEAAIKNSDSVDTEDEIEVEVEPSKKEKKVKKAEKVEKKAVKKAPKKEEKKKKPVVVDDDDDDDDDYDDFDLDDDDED